METALSERIRGTWSHTKDRLSEIDRRVSALEKRARESVAEAPRRLRLAWDQATGTVRQKLDVATSDDLGRLAARVDELAKRVEKLTRERVARASAKVVRLTRK
ncbi:MAG: hypothetical protein EXR72_11345 [Myxococcales bacterium]|nr:hypothetical protein [Myxococcales bacterium]